MVEHLLCYVDELEFLHSSVERCFGCIQALTIMNMPAENVCLHFCMNVNLIWVKTKDCKY